MSVYMTRGAEVRVIDVTSPCRSRGAGARLDHVT
ncbi:hypothetical protein A2U01_0101651, partial [Trifolium medium]|nr:hypothetical protein [Trifolium medium]